MENREIKLRAWCEDFGKFKMCYYNLNNCDNGLWFDMIDDFHSSEVHSVMQYTGFKDKDGKDIYEGDILRLNVVSEYSTHLIFWDKEQARFSDLRIEDGDCCTNYYDFDFVNDCKIIGNKFENEYLLKRI